MSYFTKESYDGDLNYASIEIYQKIVVDEEEQDILIGKHEFDNGVYHSDERTEAIEAPAGDWTVVDSGQGWTQEVNTKLDTGSSIVSPYEYEVEKRVGEVRIKLKIDSVTYLDIKWDAGTNLITIEPRPEMNLSWADFNLYESLLAKFKDLVSNFNG